VQQNDKPFRGMNHGTAAMCISDPLQHHDKWYHYVYGTHPPVEDRIARLEQLASGVKV
jgi:Zn-dependent protease with chaperone function